MREGGGLVNETVEVEGGGVSAARKLERVRVT